MKAKLVAYTMGVSGETPEELLKGAFSQCYQKPARIETLQKHIKHQSVFEHISFTFEISCSRVCWEQLVRHRVASYTAQSHRYTEPTHEDTYIYIPTEILNMGEEAVTEWKMDCEEIFDKYLKWRNRGVSKETSRYLINKGVSIKARITFNLRSLLNLLKLRTDIHAQEEIKELAWMLWDEIYQLFPNISQNLFDIFAKEEAKC